MAKVTVDVPGLIAVGTKAGGFANKATTAKQRVDGAGTGVTPGTGLSSASTLARVEDVWTKHLGDFRTDLDDVGDNLRATARTYSAYDGASADYFRAIRPADRHHYGIRP